MSEHLKLPLSSTPLGDLRDGDGRILADFSASDFTLGEDLEHLAEIVAKVNAAEKPISWCPGCHGDGWFVDSTEGGLLLKCDCVASIRDEFNLKTEQAEKLAEALRALITYPRVADLLAPKGSLGSIQDQVDEALASFEGRQ